MRQQGCGRNKQESGKGNAIEDAYNGHEAQEGRGEDA